jgi:hypothetical protein
LSNGERKRGEGNQRFICGKGRAATNKGGGYNATRKWVARGRGREEGEEGAGVVKGIAFTAERWVPKVLKGRVQWNSKGPNYLFE